MRPARSLCVVIAEVQTVSETGGPVPAFLDAVQERALDRVAGLLSYDVLLAVPPLHYTRTGARDVYEGLAELLGAFGEVRYDLRGRYLTPATVTDEAVLVGRHTGPFLGAAPTGAVCGIPVRMIVEHDGAIITRLTIWPDLAALRAAVAGADRVIDLTGAAARTGGMITALRATIPPRQTRVMVGGHRELPPAPDVPTLVAPSSAGTAVGRPKDVPKPPIPKSVRRRRGALAGGTMLVAAGALATWVAVGALHLPESPSIASGRDAGTAGTSAGAGAAGGTLGAAGGASGADGSGAAAAGGAGGTAGNASDDGTGAAAGSDGAALVLAPARQLAEGRNTVIIGSDLLFDTDSAKLTPKAKRILRDLIVQARRTDRRGTVTVSGHTDWDGSDGYNLSLSRRRAAAVADELRAGLGTRGMRFVAVGYGETRPEKPNTTAAGRRANRRVTVAFPAPTP